MTDRKYQIFVSSTFRDLLEERQDAIRNILDLRHIPAGMELFPAADVEQLEYIKRVIDQCDYYILIVGARYGSTDADGISYTEREYDHAVATDKTILAFVNSAVETIPLGKSDTDTALVASLERFRDKVMRGRLVKQWTTRADLEATILKSLIHAFNDAPQIGWVRADSAVSSDVLVQSNQLLRENAELKTELARLKDALKPQFEGIAGLDDQFNLRYTVRGANSRYARSSFMDRSIDLTWRQIFICVAGYLETPKTDGAISQGVKLCVEELDRDRPDSINVADKITIKVQLVALGLISTTVSATTQGSTAEFLRLTEKGRATFLENRIVRGKVSRPA